MVTGSARKSPAPHGLAGPDLPCGHQHAGLAVVLDATPRTRGPARPAPATTITTWPRETRPRSRGRGDAVAGSGPSRCGCSSTVRAVAMLGVPGRSGAQGVASDMSDIGRTHGVCTFSDISVNSDTRRARQDAKKWV